MKNIFFAFLFLSLSGCSDDYENNQTTATLYGSVSDKTTGDPVVAAEVKLSVVDGYGSLYAATVTGTDGCFSFLDLDPESLYAITIDHTEYKPFLQRVRVKAGVKNETHLLIERK